MIDSLVSSVVRAVLGVELGSLRQDDANRLSVHGLTVSPAPDDTLVIGIQNLEAASLRLTAGSYVFEVGRLAVRELMGKLRMEEGRPRLESLTAASAEVAGVKIQGPVMVPHAHTKAAHTPPAQNDSASSNSGAGQKTAGSWHLAPLATAEGRIQAEIIDAHLSFDADVTVPIRRGTIDFNEATVAHVGPDSRMGVSQRGIYVDAPNGRSYIFQFPTASVSGVEFEQRRVMGAWVSNRGKLQLQAFAEGLLRQVWRGSGAGFTEQARQLFQRTSIAGDIRLSDGKLKAPGMEADLLGRTDGRNAIRLHSKAVGRGVTAEMPSLSVRNAALNTSTMRLLSDEVTGTLALRIVLEGKQLKFVFDVVEVRLSGLRIHPDLTRSV